MADRSPTPRRHESALLLRLLPEQRRRLEAVAKRTGKTMSDLMRDAVMIYIAEIEEEIQMAKHREEEEAAKAFVPRSPRASRGLGLRPRPAATETSPPTVPPASPPPPTIVIQNSPAPSSQLSLEPLVQYVIAGDSPFERERRMQHVVAIIQTTTPKEDEAERLIQSFREKVEAEMHKPPSQQNTLASAVVRSAWSWLAGK